MLYTLVVGLDLLRFLERQVVGWLVALRLQKVEHLLLIDKVPVNEVLGLLGVAHQVQHRDHTLVHRSQELERPYPVAFRDQDEDLVEVLGYVPTEHEREALVWMLALHSPGYDSGGRPRYRSAGVSSDQLAQRQRVQQDRAWHHESKGQHTRISAGADAL